LDQKVTWPLLDIEGPDADTRPAPNDAMELELTRSG
jgi:hypothetical protein